MNKIADLTLPGGQTITNPLMVGPNRPVQELTLGGIITGLFSVVFLIAGFIMFIWAALGIFQYMTARGKKEELAKARAKITWAIVGFLLLSIAFAFSQYIQQIANPKSVPITPITKPSPLP